VSSPADCRRRGARLRASRLAVARRSHVLLPPRGYCGALLRRQMAPWRSRSCRSGQREGVLIMRSLLRLLLALVLLLAATDASFAVRGDRPGQAQPLADTRVQIAQLPIPTIPIPTIPIPTLPIPIGSTTTTPVATTTTTTGPSSTTTTTTSGTTTTVGTCAPIVPSAAIANTYRLDGTTG